MTTRDCLCHSPTLDRTNTLIDRASFPITAIFATHFSSVPEVQYVANNATIPSRRLTNKATIAPSAVVDFLQLHHQPCRFHRHDRFSTKKATTALSCNSRFPFGRIYRTQQSNTTKQPHDATNSSRLLSLQIAVVDSLQSHRVLVPQYHTIIVSLTPNPSRPSSRTSLPHQLI